ncbi:hypothetical protein ACWEOV_40885 [Streptomyces sp. NPDC004365]
MRWVLRGSVLEGTIEVRTALPELETGKLRMTVRRLAPSQPRLQYLIGNAAVRRLCVNEQHRPYEGTHKHMINLRGTDEDAYEPDDIPEVPLAPRVAPGTYRAILEAFVAECAITLGEDFVWVEPERGR